MALTLKQAREAYFAENHFGADGGYSSPYVLVRVFKLPVAFPNVPARVAAVRFHDLHHVLTGYATDFRGECEIGAWEVASGCGRFGAAWVLNLFALAHGLPVWPGRILRAFARGRRGRNLYRQQYDDALLEREVEPVRRELGLDAPVSPTLGDALALAPWALLGVVMNLVTLALLPLPIAGIAAGALLARRAAAPQ